MSNSESVSHAQLLLQYLLLVQGVVPDGSSERSHDAAKVEERVGDLKPSA
jgi:hypothetical protein